ncbi:MAG: SDR family oxidoreductase [Novosphingobium sp.]|nr:SDR family oxidoreductase [Novosphingobium sp.]
MSDAGPGIDRRQLLAGAAAGAAALAASGAVAAQPAAPAAGSLAGKSFLITGTSSGFGRLGALLYARLGAKVFATMRDVPRPEAEDLRRIAREEKLDLHVLEIDVLNDDQVKAGVADAERINGGPLDVLVNNAGIVLSGPVEVQDMEITNLQFDTNVVGYQRMIRAVLPGMRKRRTGAIFNVSSQMGRMVMPGMGLYAATKFAVEAMCEQLAYELVPHGIDVVIIQPGGYPTEVGQNRAKYSQELYDRIEPERAEGYPAMVESMNRMRPVRNGPVPPGSPDPIDIPNAIATIAAMPAGKRPLRMAVHPGAKPQLEINRVARESQIAMLGKSPMGDLVRAVYD